MALPNLPRLIKKNPLGSFIAAMVIIPIVMGFVWAATTTKSTQKTSPATISVSPTKKPEKPILEIFENPVQVKMPGTATFVSAKNKQTIVEGAQIQTGETGRAQVVFPGGTVTRIDNNGLIKISQVSEGPENIMITILKGRVWSRIRKLLGNESYSTETSELVATVRGTSYGHGIIEGGFDKGTVFKGKVKMTCKADEQNSMEVVPDKKALVNCEKGTGLEMLDMEPNDKTDEWLLFNKAQDIILEKRFGKDTYDDDKEVLGTETTVTPTVKYQQPTATRPPSPTPQPTSGSSTTTNNTNPTATNTPVPLTATTTPDPTPTVPPPEILRAADITQPSRTSALITVSIEGNFFDTLLSLILTDSQTGEIKNYSTIDKTNTNITASFDGLTCSGYEITVRTLGGSASTKFTVTSRC